MKTRKVTFIGILIFTISVLGFSGCGHQGGDQEEDRVGANQSSDMTALNDSHMTAENGLSPDRACTYYHEQSQGSKWKTKWC
jgi:hypothetical protein